jgi:glycosyltransferase involved in cell wall biosynthesis
MSYDLTLAICAYNCEKYIEETLSCILNQTFQQFDLLIVNDYSTDNSIAIVEKLFKQHSRQYELVNFEKNQGIGYARHFVERYVKTPYLIFIDADDLPYPSLVEKLYNKITSDSDLMAVGCYLGYINKNGKKIGGGLFLGDTNKESFYERAKNKKMFFMQPTAIYDRALALSVGGYNIEGFPAGKPRYQDFCEDLDLWTRMSDLYIDGKAIIVIPEILCKYRKHEQGLSSNTFYMSLKMKYVKTNLLRRRAGEKELTFVAFRQSLSEKELCRLKRDSVVADSLRNGVFYLKKGRIFTGVYLLLKSIILKPAYFWQKLKSNSGIILPICKTKKW